MYQLIAKTFIRSLAIFLSVSWISYAKDLLLTKDGVLDVTHVASVIIVSLAIIVGLLLWAQRIKVTKTNRLARPLALQSSTKK